MPTEKSQTNTITRPPVVVVMGHIDHGKSTLLDYIRKTNIVDGEVGGITQKLSAYEIVHADEHGADKKITFLDTPGHAAFSDMRARGARVADIAILVVSAEDSVKDQTLEAWNTIIDAKIPYIVAINKIDKDNANIEKTKMDLVEKGIYLEGNGGDVPFVLISAKKGTGVDELLSTILLVAELGDFTGDPTVPATGIVIESHRDPKRGVSATLIVKNGTLQKGMFVVADTALAGTRIIEDYKAKMIEGAAFSSPIRITGFDMIPSVGSEFTSYHNKKDAEQAAANHTEKARTQKVTPSFAEGVKIIPVVLKTDVHGMIEAIDKELAALNTNEIAFKIVNKSVGAIGESDLKMVASDKNAIVIGFNVKVEPKALETNEQLHVDIELFDIIYKLTDRMKEEIEIRRPRSMVPDVIGSAKILKTFSASKERQLVGARVTAGKLSEKCNIRIIRRDFEIGRGKIVGLQQGRIPAKEVQEANECGIMVEAKIEIAPGDFIESFVMVEK